MSHQDAIDENYIKLAHFYKVIGDKLNIPETVVEKILQNINEINYQIPPNNYFVLKKPHLIGYTALQFALESRKIETFKWLITRGANFMIQNGNNESLLHLAIKLLKPNKFGPSKIQSNQHQFIDLLLSAQIGIQSPENLCNKDGLTHLHIACMRNNVQAVELFLQNNADINQAVNLDSSNWPGFTPLHFAAKYSALETAGLLVMHGAGGNLKDAKGMTPLHLVLKENMDTLKSYHDIDSDSNKKQKNNIDNNIKMINLLSAYIFANDIFAVDGIGLSQLHIASTYLDTSIIETMLDRLNLNYPVNVNSLVWPGYTALHFAAHCSLKTLMVLLNNGADILAKDAEGVTPFDVCMKKYGAKDLYSIVMTQHAWKDILFSDYKTKLSELLYVMQDEKKFLDFLDIHSANVNACILRNSTLWPGCAILHLAIMFIGKFDKEINYDQEDDDSNGSDCGPEEYGLKTIKKCLQLGADVSIQNARGATPLHLAFRMRMKCLTELLLRKCPTKTNPIDEFGLSHLHIACASGFEALVKTFMDRVCGRRNVNGAVNSNFRWYQEDTCESSNCWMSRFLMAGSTPLHTVVSQGNSILAKILIKRGADVYAKDCNGITPIHQSLSANFSETYILKDFFAMEDLRDSVANCGLSHLHLACYANNTVAAQRLLNQGANIEGVIMYEQPADCPFKYNKVLQWDEFSMDDSRHRQYCSACDDSFNSLCYLSAYAGCTPLMMAMKRNSNSVILFLVQRGADCLAKKLDGTVLFYDVIDYHVRSGNCSWVPKLLRYPPVQQRIEADIGLTRLHVACILLDVPTIGQLLAAGLDPNARLKENSSIWPGYTSLHLMLLPRPSADGVAIVTIIKMLLSSGANVTVANAQMETPIHFAIDKTKASTKDRVAPETSSALLQLLLKYHANFKMDVYSSRNISHFHAACMTNDLEIVHNFLLHGADVDHAVDYSDDDYGGFTALHLACLRQCKETVELLLQYGANASVTDSSGNTPLHIVARSWHLDIFNYLVGSGAVINAENLLLETPLETFLKSDKVTNETIRLFLNHGCNINVFNPLSQIGLIGLALQTRTKVELIAEDPIYNAIISAPDIRSVDFMDRTPIHNLVSVNEKGGSIRNFISPCVAVSESVLYNMKAINGFDSLGYNIDHQDERGWTALHAAVPFDNREGLMALLSCGADFNISDADGNSPYMLGFEQSKSKLRCDAQTLQFFSMHVRKMDLFGLYISKGNRDVDALVCQQRSYYSHDKLNLVAEVDQARLSHFGTHPITLYDFLSEYRAVVAYPTMPVIQSQVIDQIFQNHGSYLRKNFPGLVGLFYLQYRKALNRDYLTKSAHDYLNSIVRVQLPIVCVNMIFKFLANDDLKVFITSINQTTNP